MTATVSGSTAILKVLYPGGKLDPTIYDNSTYLSVVDRATDFGAEVYTVPVITETPQGLSYDATEAFANVAQGNYQKFQVTRSKYFGVARITDEALLAAKSDKHAMVNLWKTEMDMISRGVVLQLAAFSFATLGAAKGVIGSISTTTITLATITDITKFSVGEKIQVSDIDPSASGAALRSGSCTITALNRTTGVITCSGNITAGIAAAIAGDFIFRKGDFASAFAGAQAWVNGGTTPGTLYQLNRNTDPIRLSGHTYDATGVPFDEAIMEMSARIGLEGETGDMCFVHPRDMANMNKLFEGKTSGRREVNVKSQVNGGHAGFKSIEVESDNGVVKVVSDRNVPRNKAFLLNMKNWQLKSLGAAPQIANFDSQEFLRVSNEMSQEVRIAFYGQNICNGPVNNGKITNFGL